MAKYYIRYNDLLAQADSFKNISSTIGGLENRLNSIANAIDGRDSSMATLKRQLQNYGKIMPATKNRIVSCSSTLSEVVKLYLNAETTNYNSIAEAKSAASPESVSEKEKSKSLIPDIVWKYIGELGAPGAIISMIGEPVAGWLLDGTIIKDANDPEYYAGVIKSGVGAIKELISLNTKILDERNLKILGYAVNKVKYPFASWTTRFQAGFQDSIESSIKGYTEGGFKSVLSWAGVGLTGLINGVGNYNDYKAGKISAERAISGTVLQTVIDVGKGIAVGAAATAVVGAVCGAAPVLAVAAVSVGLSAGLDFISEKLTGKDFSKASSDAILDGIDNVGKAVDKAKKKLQEGFNSIANCFKNPFGMPRAIWASGA